MNHQPETTPRTELMAPVVPPPQDSALITAPLLQMQLLSSMMEPQAAPQPSIDFGAFFRALRRFWPVVILCAGLCAGAAAWYLQRTPRLYLALGEISVGQERSELLPSAAVRGEDLKSLEMLKSIERQIAGQNVLLEVARRFNLHHDPGLAGARAESGLNDDEVVTSLAKRVSASLERGTRNIVISVEDTEPQRARDICQAVIDLVVQREPGAVTNLRAKNVAALEKQAAEARDRVDASQKAVNAFREKHPGLPLEENPSDLKTNSYEDRLKALTAESVKAEEEVSSFGAIVDRINAAGTDLNALLSVPGLANQEAAVAQRKALGEAMAKLAESDYGPKHPTYQTMQKQITEITGGLLEVLQTAARSEQIRYEKAKDNLARIEREVKALKGNQAAFAVVAGEFQKLARELKASRDGYSAVLARLNEEKTNASSGAGALTVAAEPLVPTHPNKPRPKLILAAGGAAGVMMGLGMVVLLMLLDRSVRSVSAGERALRIPALGVLPELKNAGGKNMLVYGRERDSAAGEAFRSLRAALGTGARVQGARSFLFTSARAGEGKSLVSINFAASLAQQGYRTLLIDANLRAPVIDEVLLDSKAEQGLADYFSGQSEADAKLCRPTAMPNLFLFAAGVPEAHPGEILNEGAFAALLKESLKWFHRVVIDTPAAGRFADALPLARHADAVCIVVRPGLTLRSEALRTVQRLTAAGARPCGFVMNAAPEAAMKEAAAGGPVSSMPLALPAAALPAVRA